MFIISISKKYKFAVLPLGAFLLTVAILSFVLAGRLGAINKQGARGDLKDETVQKARTFAIVLAACYTGAIALVILYIWVFKPDVYNFMHAKLSNVMKLKDSDDSDGESDDDGSAGSGIGMFGSSVPSVKIHGASKELQGAEKLRKRQMRQEIKDKKVEMELLHQERIHNQRLADVESVYKRRMETPTAMHVDGGGGGGGGVRYAPARRTVSGADVSSEPSFTAEAVGDHLSDLFSSGAAALANAGAAAGKTAMDSPLGKKAAAKLAQVKNTLKPGEADTEQELAVAQLEAQKGLAEQEAKIMSQLAAFGK